MPLSGRDKEHLDNRRDHVVRKGISASGKFSLNQKGNYAKIAKIPIFH
jgi:hypothetical protein